MTTNAWLHECGCGIVDVVIAALNGDPVMLTPLQERDRTVGCYVLMHGVALVAAPGDAGPFYRLHSCPIGEVELRNL